MHYFLIPAFILITVPFILAIISVYISFMTRGSLDLMLARKFLYYGAFEMAYSGLKYWDVDDYGGSLFIIAVIWGGLLGGLSAVIVEGYLMEALWTLGTIALLIAPRYFLDIVGTLRYSFKSRESERLAELEQQSEELKKQVKELQK